MRRKATREIVFIVAAFTAWCYITTNRGVLELVTFPGPTDAERITIEYSKTPGVPASHHYLFRGWPTNGDAGNWSGTQPTYFTLHKNWFIVSWQPELDAFVKRSLGQTSRRLP